MVGTNAMNLAAVSTDLLAGLTYFGGFTGGTAAAPYSSVTFQVNLASGATALLPQTDTNVRITDIGNCAFKPARPTVAKSFTPAFGTTAPGATTRLIALSNSNSVPTYLTAAFLDNLPVGMTVSATAGIATFTDLLLPLITPTLSVTANATGGACATATAVVGGRTRVTGTSTNGPISGVCTVTVEWRY